MTDGRIDSLLAQGRTERYERGDLLVKLGDPIPDLGFPLSGMISLTIDTSEGQTVEVAVTGREGFVGVGRFLGREISDTNAVVQVPGEVFHAEPRLVQEIAAADAGFSAAINRFLNSLLVETSQTAVCNQVHSVEQRTARWLLHAADRAGTDELQLTHEFLSQMLAVRRSSVTTVIGIFKRAGLTSTKRGLITVADREGLRGLTCECYAIVYAATPRLDQPSAM
ncbi:MAG TPA: Crp/Fnr family transcriptional regulator [Candidatus Limnocylindrales bacterium]|nr:Crp/Fnr family transcriptional regulator [Candidatus Limnocylindrales bacterium]